MGMTMLVAAKLKKKKRNSKKIADWLHNGGSCILMMILERSQWGKPTNYLTPHIMWLSCQLLLPRMHSNQKLLIICGCLVRHDCYAFILYVLILFPFLSQFNVPKIAVVSIIDNISFRPIWYRSEMLREEPVLLVLASKHQNNTYFIQKCNRD